MAKKKKKSPELKVSCHWHVELFHFLPSELKPSTVEPNMIPVVYSWDDFEKFENITCRPLFQECDGMLSGLEQ